MPRDGEMEKGGLRGEDSCGSLAVLRRVGGRRASTNNFKSYFFGEQCRVTEFEPLLYVRWCQCIKYCYACFRFDLFPTFTINHFAARFLFPTNRKPYPLSFPLLPPASIASLSFQSHQISLRPYLRVISLQNTKKRKL